MKSNTSLVVKTAAVLFLIVSILSNVKAQTPVFVELRTDTAWVTLSADSAARAWQVSHLPFSETRSQYYDLRTILVKHMPTVGQRPEHRYAIDQTGDGRIDIVTNSEAECVEAKAETRDCLEVDDKVIFSDGRGGSYEVQSAKPEAIR